MFLHFETAAQKTVLWYTHTHTHTQSGRGIWIRRIWTSVEEESGCIQQSPLNVLISDHWMHLSVSLGCTHHYPFDVPQLSSADGAACPEEHPVWEKRRKQQFQGCSQSAVNAAAATLGGHKKSWNKRRQR